LVFWKPGSRLSYQRLPGLLWSEELKSFRDFRPLVGQENVVAVAFWWVAVSSRQEFTIPAEKSWGNGSRSCIINVAMENFPVFSRIFLLRPPYFSVISGWGFSSHVTGGSGVLRSSESSGNTSILRICGLESQWLKGDVIKSHDGS
jgi:hypothetical protein